MPPRISRRTLLSTAAAGTLSGLAGPLLPRAWAANAAVPTTLVAGSRTIDVHGRAAKVFGITQADGTHGLVTQVGTPFRVMVRNDIGTDTLIHWHGLTPPYQQDGVPGISAPAVAPGETARYDFPLTFPGTFWMHSHQGLQEQSMMTAPLIVREQNPSADEQEVVLLLHDFSFQTPEEIYGSLRKATAGSAGKNMDRMAGMGGGHMQAMEGMPAAAMAMAMPAPPEPAMAGMTTKPRTDKGTAGMAMDLNDVLYDAFLANDRTLADPQVVRVDRGGRVLLRVINASAASNYVVELGTARATLVAVDGRPVQPMRESTFPVAMAQRLDLSIQLDTGMPVLPVFAVLEGERKRTGIVLAAQGGTIRKFAEVADKAAAPIGFAVEQTLRARVPLPSRPADRVHQVDLTGSMDAYVWGLNGVAYGHNKPLMVKTGERVEIVMTNRTMMSHPMHLHGHAFQVVAIDGQRFPGALRDTVLVPPMRQVTVAIDADNPGIWAFHCHNLYHMTAGMMTTVLYEGV